MFRQTLLIIWLLLLLPGPAPAQDEDVGLHVDSGEISLEDGVYYLDAQLDYRLTEPVREALENGVALIFELEIEVREPRRWLWDKDIARLTQRYAVSYHALSSRYVLRNLNSGESRSFSSEYGVLRALGDISRLPLIDRQLLEQDAVYEIALRARLDLEMLPPPLRTVAYVSPNWRLVSEWKTWRVQD